MNRDANCRRYRDNGDYNPWYFNLRETRKLAREQSVISTTTCHATYLRKSAVAVLWLLGDRILDDDEL